MLFTDEGEAAKLERDAQGAADATRVRARAAVVRELAGGTKRGTKR